MSEERGGRKGGGGKDVRNKIVVILIVFYSKGKTPIGILNVCTMQYHDASLCSTIFSLFIF